MDRVFDIRGNGDLMSSLLECIYQVLLATHCVLMLSCIKVLCLYNPIIKGIACSYNPRPSSCTKCLLPYIIIQSHTLTHTHTYTHAHIHVRTHIYTHRHTCTHTCTHTYTHKHTCTHTHTHIHTIQLYIQLYVYNYCNTQLDYNITFNHNT